VSALGAVIVAAGRLEMGGQLAHWWPHLGRPLAELGTKFAAQFRDKREREGHRRGARGGRAGGQIALALVSAHFWPFWGEHLEHLELLELLEARRRRNLRPIGCRWRADN